jgi:hypothetical protein
MYDQKKYSFQFHRFDAPPVRTVPTASSIASTHSVFDGSQVETNGPLQTKVRHDAPTLQRIVPVASCSVSTLLTLMLT